MDRQDYRDLFKSDNVSPPVPGRAPVYLQEEWQFPYLQGTQFVIMLLGPGAFQGVLNYKGVNAALADPPKSEEQVMHPEKYLKSPRDNPKPVQLPDLGGVLGKGWAMKDSDTLGEFDLQVMLRENYMDKEGGAEGWGGARYAFYQNGDNALV